MTGAEVARAKKLLSAGGPGTLAAANRKLPTTRKPAKKLRRAQTVPARKRKQVVVRNKPAKIFAAQEQGLGPGAQARQSTPQSTQKPCRQATITAHAEPFALCDGAQFGTNRAAACANTCATPAEWLDPSEHLSAAALHLVPQQRQAGVSRPHPAAALQ